MTTGQWMFYIGIFGMFLSVILSIIVWIKLVDSRKNLNRELNREYGIDV